MTSYNINFSVMAIIRASLIGVHANGFKKFPDAQNTLCVVRSWPFLYFPPTDSLYTSRGNKLSYW